MATRKKAPKRAAKKAADTYMVDMSLTDYGMSSIRTYAETVNLERSVPDLFDGLKPVQRRILWAASHNPKGIFTKTARVVGDTLGKYHPHGDASVSAAITSMMHHPTSTLEGKGNWGGLLDDAAAMRYTNMRLSKYGLSFFDPDYINRNVTMFVPNYDDKDVEPVTLPAMMPNVLINGAEGIGMGITTSIPAFTVDSVVEVLVRLLSKEKMTAEDFATTLKPALKWGGRLVQSKENQAAWLAMFQSSEASVQYEPELHIDVAKKSITISEWPPGLNPVRFIEKVREMPETTQAYNSEGVTTFTLECSRRCSAAQFNEYVSKVQRLAQVRRSYKINVTDRVASIEDGVVKYETKFYSLSVPQLIVRWLRQRIDLEKRSLEWRIGRQEDAVAYTELLIYASTKLDIIFQALRTPDSKKFLQSKLKLTEQQAAQILELRVRQLSKLDQEEYKQKLKEQKAHLADLNKWLKRPRAKLRRDLARLKAAITADTSK